MDYEAPIKQVRVLIADMATPPILDDQSLQTYLEMQGWAPGARWAVYRAAADALDALATGEVMLAKVIRTQDLTTDGAKVADALRKQAAGLRARADDEDPDLGGVFEVIDSGHSHHEAEEWRY